MCLSKARRNYVCFGACEEDCVGNVRPPTSAEFPPIRSLDGLEKERIAHVRREVRIQVLAIVRAMRVGAVGIIDGSIRISPLVHLIDQPDLEQALLSFVGIASESDDLPIGNERDPWDRDALVVKDRQRAGYEGRVKEHALEDCRAAEALLTANLLGSSSQ